MTSFPAQILQRLQRPATTRTAPATALDADARTVRGVRAERGAGGTLSVMAAVEVEAEVEAEVEVEAQTEAATGVEGAIGAEVDPREASAEGAVPAARAGLAKEVRAALGLGDDPPLVALSREQTLLGEAELPSDDEAEVRSMARLALGRDYAIEGVDSAGDFMHVDRSDGRSTVLLAAAPRPRIAETLARVGAVTAARVAIRALGVVSLLRRAPELGAGTVLAIDATAAQCECTVARDGRLLQSRGFSIAGEAQSRATAILSELRRMLAAMRAADPTLRLARVLVLGDAATATAVLAGLEPVAGVRGARLESHPAVSLDRLAPAAREVFRSACFPLAGLLLEDGGDGRSIDLLHPTPEIDVAARTRQRILAVAGVMVVAALAGWTFGARSWRDLEEQRADLEAKARNALPELRRSKRDEFLVRHLEVATKVEPQWLAYLDAIHRFAPDQDAIVFEGISAQLSDSEVEYTREGAFVSRPTLRFDLAGEARDRATADALRDAFVRARGVTLSSTGADGRGGQRLPAPFAYTLRTAELAPKLGESGEAAASPAASAEGAAPAASKERTP
ncbi:MAG: hypothetical protein GC172_13485 [Phycisphaera sp.]|nr:hypothetical protein [Phycisphaera sp.]